MVVAARMMMLKKVHGVEELEKVIQLLVSERLHDEGASEVGRGLPPRFYTEINSSRRNDEFVS